MITLRVPDMSCGHCAGVIEKAVKAVDGSARVAIDLKAGQVRVDSSAADAAVREAIRAAGYPNEPAGA